MGGDSSRGDDEGGDPSTETTWEEIRRRDNGHEGDAPLSAKSPFRSPAERTRERREMSNKTETRTREKNVQPFPCRHVAPKDKKKYVN